MDRKNFLSFLGKATKVAVGASFGLNPFSNKIENPKDLFENSEKIHQEFMTVANFYLPSIKKEQYLAQDGQIPKWITELYLILTKCLNLENLKKIPECKGFFFMDRPGFFKLFDEKSLNDPSVIKTKKIITNVFNYVTKIEKIIQEKSGQILDENYISEENDYINGNVRNDIPLIKELMRGLIKEGSINLSDFFNDNEGGGISIKSVNEDSLLELGYNNLKSEVFLNKLSGGDLTSIKFKFKAEERQYYIPIREQLFGLLIDKYVSFSNYLSNIEKNINSAREIIHREKQRILQEDIGIEEKIKKGRLLLFTYLTFLSKLWEGTYGNSADGQVIGAPSHDSDVFTDCSVYLYELINELFPGQVTNRDVFYRGNGEPHDQIAGYSEKLCIDPVYSKRKTNIANEQPGVYLLAFNRHMILSFPDIEKNFFCGTENSIKYRPIKKDGSVDYIHKSGVGRGYYDRSTHIPTGYLCLSGKETVEKWLNMK